MGCMELRIDPEWAWEPRKGFLGLPRELRDVIYHMVLIEPPKWERRHAALCDSCPRDTSTYERPVFDDVSVLKRSPKCKCKCRRNTSILLANRQIHRETAPMFWSRNTFCFDTATQFGDEVGSKLRQENLELLRHVSILRVTWQEYQVQWVWRRDRQPPDDGAEAMWTALLRCTGLETIEMGAENVYRVTLPQLRSSYDFTAFVPQLREKLPHLREFALASMLIYDVNPTTGKYDAEMGWWEAPPMSSRHLLYVKSNKALDLDEITTASQAKEAARSFRTNFLVHLRFALETTLLGVAERDFSTDPDEPYALGYTLSAALNDSNTVHDLTLRDKSVTAVHLLGLPLSQATRIRHVKERWREDARRKAGGKPTVWEEKFKAVVRERQCDRRVKRVEQASKEREAYVVGRVARKEEKEARERKQARKAVVKERVTLARSERLARETREVERKRVPRPK